MQIVPYRAERLEEVVGFIARLNADGAHHIGYWGLEPADIAQSIRSANPPAEVGHLLAEQDGRLVGLLGIDSDSELGRAWLFGPLIERGDWQAAAANLYAAALGVIPAQVFEHELFCDLRNLNVQAFADLHQFPHHSDAAILNFVRAGLAALPAGGAAELSEPFFAQFEALHQELFPRTYASSEQLIAKRSEHARIFIAAEGRQLLGYVCVKVEPELRQGYIDYVGTAASARRRGIAKALLGSALHWMFASPEVQRADLTVNADNQAALALYARLGFEHERTMRAYRKRVSPL